MDELRAFLTIPPLLTLHIQARMMPRPRYSIRVRVCFYHGLDLFHVLDIAGGCRPIPLPSICIPASLSIADNRFDSLPAIRAPNDDAARDEMFRARC